MPESLGTGSEPRLALDFANTCPRPGAADPFATSQTTAAWLEASGVLRPDAWGPGWARQRARERAPWSRPDPVPTPAPAPNRASQSNPVSRSNPASPERAFRMPPSEERILHREALALRSALLGLLEARSAAAPARVSDVHALNRILGSAAHTRALTVDAEGAALVVERTVATEPPGLLAPVALAAARLLAGVDPARLRRCAADGCTTWFVDTSKGGRRRWCSMARCGNRAKVARHRSRKAGGS